MSDRRLRNILGGFVALGLAAGLAACSSPSSVTTSASPTASGGTKGTRPSGPGPNFKQADLEWIELCKDYSGTPGPAVTFTIAVDIGNNGSVDQTFQTSLANGQCEDIWNNTSLTGADSLTVTETVPSGYAASWVLTTILAGGSVTTRPSVSGNVASGAQARGGMDRGDLIVFTNTGSTPPPPPGLAGCTPGYWKQSQHFDSWPAPYTPNTLFSSVFENAFPGMTLLQVASQGGGGLNALGRHTVAALLSAGSVNYGMTPAQVIAAFNAAFPSGDIEGLHLQFAALNERGCTLN